MRNNAKTQEEEAEESGKPALYGEMISPLALNHLDR
jgi:hypothetical protein